MLKYEQTEEYTEAYQKTEYTQGAAPREAAVELLETLAKQERALQNLDQQQEYTEKLMATVQTEARKFRRSRAVTRGCIISFGILMGLLVLVFVMQGLMQGKWDWSTLSSMTSMTGILGTVAVSSKTYKSAASELSQIEDLRAVGPLAECLDIEEKTIRAQVADALIRLLPRLQASDADLLNTEQRACLNKALWGKNDALIVAILRAYEQVGDETALPIVVSLAHKADSYPNIAQIAQTTGLSQYVTLEPKASAPFTASVIAAAQACLPYLQKRVELQRASQTLLRGSSAHAVVPDTLLRAAQPTPDAAPEQLLRATTKE